MPEFYITDDFVTPIECLSDALGSIQGLYEENVSKINGMPNCLLIRTSMLLNY